jgi:cytochrome c biogenesis protein CcmG, thiol:disulfide interchange protein DsbE
MTYRMLLCSAWMASALSLQAGPVKLAYMKVGAVTYSNVTVFSANSTDLFFTSDHGMSNVKLKFLSRELQKQFHYNSSSGEKAEQQQIDNDKRFQADLAASITARIRGEQNAIEIEVREHYSEAGLADAVSDDSPLGKAVPDLNFEDWIGPNPDLAGKIMLISVWSPKSAACRKWIPPLNNLNKIFAGKIEVFGVTTATEAEVQATEPKINFPCALDPDGKFLKAANVATLPCALLVDTNGTVRYQGHPAAIDTNTVQMLLKGTPEE